MERSFGSLLAAARKAVGLNQTQLALSYFIPSAAPRTSR